MYYSWLSSHSQPFVEALVDLRVLVEDARLEIYGTMAAIKAALTAAFASLTFLLSGLAAREKARDSG